MLLVINSDTPPVEVKHICWFTKRNYSDSRKIVLYEMVNAKYPHPQAPEDAWIWVIEERQIEEHMEREWIAGSLILMEANQNVITREQKDFEG